MRRITLLLLATAGCAGGGAAKMPAFDDLTFGQTHVAVDETAAWNRAWDQVVEKDRPVDAIGYTFAKAEDGAIVVARTRQVVSGLSGNEVADQALLADVRRRLDGAGFSPVLAEAANGAVTLRGQVSTRTEASNAARIAVGTPGADQVLSYLRWE
jgi:hypothetical protein